MGATGNRPPDYPAECRRRHQAGTVTLSLMIAVDGTVISAVITSSSGYAKLDVSALSAASTWRFTPAMEDGQSVATQVIYPVGFTLKD